MTPVRTCIGCRRTDAPNAMLRLVVAGDRVVVDSKRLLPGRGAWLHRDAGCLSAAERRRAWGRALRATGPLDVSAVRDALEAPL